MDLMNVKYSFPVAYYLKYWSDVDSVFMGKYFRVYKVHKNCTASVHLG